MKCMIINGPNLNMLEYRNSDIYGKKNLKEIENQVNEHLNNNNFKNKCYFVQSNYEGEIIEYIHKAVIESYELLIINPGAFSHYSYGILDALEIFKGYKIEVHLSDIKNREKFRQELITSRQVDKVISGYHGDGYVKALEFYIKMKKDS